MKTKTANVPSVQTRLRVRVGEEIAMGPGKVELLEFVEQTGSITKAARKMGLSYMRAWTLIRTMNACFKEPLVIAARGGSKGGGGAKLTKSGSKALAAYHEMTARCLEATKPGWKQLKSLLKPSV